MKLEKAYNRRMQLLEFMMASPIFGLLYISLKAPFRSDDGRIEYMWVEVTRWSGSAIEGTLINDPFLVKRLKAGSQVTVKEGDGFDFIRHRPDGIQLGNETGVILQRSEHRKDD